ncbi:sigma-70 family RNA polymerase sigma factor [Enterovibrio sp. ZSDZ35]|uniref:Sigma-70 family RNA polymerase sigma factor n=1 Tax=Enterovibrio qingdaonensis TaxID=2899818 RepID=A0ABT5QTG1_9GAMM|nr:sigma-70 family RNA polymerase sigma factor [Enterovibrio sp. ZSDZ35]MDD1784269.1 sigma-70 family RNA polymerase sigma factor [Enterovibrio sp. ZSDZ35]
MNNNTDENLMLSFSAGDQGAFSELYLRHRAPLYRYVLRQLGVSQHSRAEELFQDVWFRVIDKRASYEASAKFTTWLYRIAHNIVIDEYRKQQSEKDYHAQLDGDEAWTQPDNPAERQQSALKHCMHLLAPKQREAFLLRHEAGFEPAQICDIVDAKPETLKTRLRYALDQLRQCLTKKLGGRE